MKKYLLIGSGAILLLVVYLYSRGKTAFQGTTSITGGYPINSLPGRQFALNPNFNPTGAPPRATFAPFSGVPFIESLLPGTVAPTNANVLPSGDNSATGGGSFIQNVPLADLLAQGNYTDANADPSVIGPP
jgi:hypothetical protein